MKVYLLVVIVIPFDMSFVVSISEYSTFEKVPLSGLFQNSRELSPGVGLLEEEEEDFSNE